MKKYSKAEYIKILKCPKCKKIRKNVLITRDDFVYRTDDEGRKYIECPCGCKFVDIEKEIMEV